MHVLFNWKAKRAGGRITVYGEDAYGKAEKIVGVDVIQPSVDGIVAVDKNGVTHRLTSIVG